MTDLIRKFIRQDGGYKLSCMKTDGTYRIESFDARGNLESITSGGPDEIIESTRTQKKIWKPQTGAMPKLLAVLPADKPIEYEGQIYSTMRAIIPDPNPDCFSGNRMRRHSRGPYDD
jgi:hypothetical protein